MKIRWQKIVAVLGIAAIVVSSNNVLTVKAAEETNISGTTEAESYEDAENGSTEETTESEKTGSIAESENSEETTESEETAETGNTEETTETEGTDESINTEEIISISLEDEKQLESEAETELEAMSDENITDVTAEVIYNTGNDEQRIVNKEAYDSGIGDGAFDENGGFTIQIPEKNPFFPYEVQFKYDDSTVEKWFMSPDDSIEVDGHTFSVSADFDDTVITQMSLNVAGDKIVIYPEKKEFTDGSGSEGSSFKSQTIDLTGYTPIELTMITFSDVFKGRTRVENTADIDVFGYVEYKDGKIDLYAKMSTLTDEGDVDSESQATFYVSGGKLGEISIKTRYATDWITASVYTQNETERKEVLNKTIGCSKTSLNRTTRLSIRDNTNYDDEPADYISLSINPGIYSSSSISYVKAYEGEYNTAEAAINSGKDITAKIYNNPNMAEMDEGYYTDTKFWGKYVTLVAYDSNGNTIGSVPVQIYFEGGAGYIITYEISYCLGHGLDEIDKIESGAIETTWYELVNKEAYEVGFGDDGFAEDGSYTIKIPEKNPSFPYKVLFCTGDKDGEYYIEGSFKSVDDSIEVDGHTYYVSAEFDNNDDDNNNDDDDDNNNNDSGNNSGDNSNSEDNSSSGDDNSSESSSAGNNTNNAAKPNSLQAEVIPVEGFAFKSGYTMSQVDVSQGNTLAAELLNKYYGQYMYLNAIFANDFGLTIDMSGVPMLSDNIELSYKLAPETSITQDFDVIHAIPNLTRPLGFDAIFNFNIGSEYIGKKAYLFMLNEAGTGYEPAGETIVNEIGNIAFNSKRVMDVIVFIEK